MASFDRLPSGNWRYRVFYKDEGKRKVKSKSGFRTKKEAQLAAARMEEKIAQGVDLARDR